jgi:hypothetical protein
MDKEIAIGPNLQACEDEVASEVPGSLDKANTQEM